MSRKGRVFKYTRFSRFASKEDAKDLFSYTDEEIKEYLRNGSLIEITKEE